MNKSENKTININQQNIQAAAVDDSMFESIEDDYLRRIAEKSYQEKGFEKQMSFENFHKFAMQEIKKPNEFKDKESGCVYRQDTHDNNTDYRNEDYDGFYHESAYVHCDFADNHEYPWDIDDEACVSKVAYGTISVLCDNEIDYMIKKFKWQHFNEGDITDFLPRGKYWKGYDFTCWDKDKPYPATEEELEILQEEKKFEKFKNTYIENGFENQLSLDDFLTLSRHEHAESLTNHYRHTEFIGQNEEVDIGSFEFHREHITYLGDMSLEKIQPEVDKLIGKHV